MYSCEVIISYLSIVNKNGYIIFCYVTIDVKQNLYTKSDSTDIIEITTNQIRS